MPAQPAWFHRLDEILADQRGIGLLRSLPPTGSLQWTMRLGRV